MQATRKLSIETNPTVTEFLQAFFPSPDELIHLRAFKPKGEPDTLFNRPAKLSFTRSQLALDGELQRKLLRLNQTRGIYFVVNAGGDSKADITRFNAFFMEIDDLPLEEQHAALDAAPVQPSVRVETLKSVHAYWLVSGDCDRNDWEEVQRGLLAFFGSDPKIKDASRVMRLPHFNHVQYDVESGQRSFKKVEIVEWQPLGRYTADEMKAAFPAPQVKEQNSAPEVPIERQASPPTFATWQELNTEARKRILSLPTATLSSDGQWAHAKGICHGGQGNTALYVNLASGAYGCLYEPPCSSEAIRRALGLPEYPTEEPAQESEEAVKDTPSYASVLRLSDVQPERVEWLWHPYIPFGKLTIFEGDPGVGKSWATCAISAAVTNGFGFPNAPMAEAKNVLLLSAEDGLSDTIRPRLDSLGADVSRVFAVDGLMVFDRDGMQRLEDYIRQTGAALVFIDPLFAFAGAKTDIYRDNEVRAITSRLAEIAAKQGCAIVGVRHLTKHQAKALYAGGGSIAFSAAARSVILFGQDPDDSSKCGFVQTKTNLAEAGCAVGYKIEDGHFYWTGKSDLTKERILSIPTGDTEKSAVDEAVDFLREALKDGKRPCEEVQNEAATIGIASSALRRAKSKLKVHSKRVTIGNQGEGAWVWVLPM